MKLTFTEDDDHFPEPFPLPKGYSADHFDEDLNLEPNKLAPKQPTETDVQPKPMEMPNGKDAKRFDPDMGPMVDTGRQVPITVSPKDDFIEAEAAVGGGGGGGGNAQAPSTPPTTLGRRAHEEAFGTMDSPKTPTVRTAKIQRRPPPSTPPNAQPKTPRARTKLQPVEETKAMEVDGDDGFLDGSVGAGGGGGGSFTDGQSSKRANPKRRTVGEDPELASTLDEVREHEKEAKQVIQAAFETLGLQPGSTKAQITRAYKKLSTKHHPDKGGDEATMKKINDAYNKLVSVSGDIDDTKADWIRKNYQFLYMRYYRGNPEYKLTAPMAKALKANTGLKTIKEGMSVADALKIMYREFAQIIPYFGRQLDSRATASHHDTTGHSVAKKKMRLMEEEEV
jgi:hypothetical protein